MANFLTSLRLLLIFPVALSFAFVEFLPAILLLVLILLAIATDYLDGKVARALGTDSSSGMLFDHASDFLFVTISLAAAAYAGVVSPLLPALITIAFTQYVLDSYFLFRQKQLRMSFLGRWNGVFYFLPLLLIAASRLELDDTIHKFFLISTVWVANILMVSTIASLIDRGMAPLRKS